MNLIARIPRKWRVAIVFAAIGMLCALFIGGSDGFYAQWRLSRQITALRRTNAELRRQNARLRERIVQLERDTSYLERIARERYGMARPGERVYRVIQPAERANRGANGE